jgi:hypothetical protein
LQPSDKQQHIRCQAEQQYSKPEQDLWEHHNHPQEPQQMPEIIQPQHQACEQHQQNDPHNQPHRHHHQQQSPAPHQEQWQQQQQQEAGQQQEQQQQQQKQQQQQQQQQQSRPPHQEQWQLAIQQNYSSIISSAKDTADLTDLFLFDSVPGLADVLRGVVAAIKGRVSKQRVLVSTA